MPSVDIRNLFSLYRFPTSRRIFAHKNIQEQAVALNLEKLVEHLEAALAFDIELFAKESRWRRPATATQTQPRDIDRKIDPIHGAISSALKRMANILGDDNPLALQARELHNILYPQGVGVLIRQNHIEQLAENTRVIQVLSSPDWSALLPDFGIHVYMPQLRTFNREFEVLVAHMHNLQPNFSFEELQSGRDQGQDKLCETIALILSDSLDPSPETRKMRDALLAPIVLQNEQIGTYLRQRRPAPEIDPDTGQAEPEASASTQE